MKWYWIRNWDYHIEAILQIFNRIHEAIIQDPSILNVVEDYQILSNHDVPDNIWGSPKLSDNGYQMDIIWGHLKPKLLSLSKIAESVLVVSHITQVKKEYFSSFEKIRLSFYLDSILESHLPYFL